MLPLTMSGGPYIYDREAKRFVVRPSAQPRREALPDLPDEPSLPPPGVVKRPLSRERRRLVVWLASACLLVVWLILLTLWTRQLPSRMRMPLVLPESLPGALFKKELPK
jgi:hypothetical protein